MDKPDKSARAAFRKPGFCLMMPNNRSGPVTGPFTGPFTGPLYLLDPSAAPSLASSFFEILRTVTFTALPQSVYSGATKPCSTNSCMAFERFGYGLVAATGTSRHHALDGHAPWQPARGNDLQPVIVKGYLDIAAVNRIVAVHHRIGYEFPQGSFRELVNVMAIYPLYHGRHVYL